MGELPAQRAISPDEANKMAAFRTFDMSKEGTINYFDVRLALLGVDGIRAATSDRGSDLRDLEIEEAAHKVGVEIGGLVTYAQFSRMAGALVLAIRAAAEYHAQRELQRHASSQQQYADAMVVAGEGTAPPTSPLRGEAHALVTSDEHFPELGPIQKAFFAFDIDQSGAVTWLDVPGMLEILGVGPKPSGDKKAVAKFELKWRNALQKELLYPKQVGELLNVRDFHDLALIMNPKLKPEFPARPPPPKPPTPEPAPAPPAEPEPEPEVEQPYEKTASELAREEAERLEEERRRLEEEERAREEAAKRAAARRLYLQHPNNAVLTVEDCTEASTVADVKKKVVDEHCIPHCAAGQIRLVYGGYEMNPKKTLGDYGVRTGHPTEHKGTVVKLLFREAAQDAPAPRPATTEIYAVTPSQMTLTLTCKLDESVAEQMRKVEAAAGIPCPVMRVICNGRELPSTLRLREAGVCAFDTLYILRREG